MGEKLPKELRPRTGRYKTSSGLDFPSWFTDGLKAIDREFYTIWHPYKTIWDPVINEYSGSLEDPRFVIQDLNGELIFGWPERDPKTWAPMPDNSWHIWRLSWPSGWGHIVKIESDQPEYLRLLLTKLCAQKRHTDRYGLGSYSKVLANQQQEEQEAAKVKHDNTLLDVQHENKWFLNRVKENMERGIVNPTMPTKETISSFSGQTYRTRLERPLDDREGGLYIPDSWRE